MLRSRSTSLPSDNAIGPQTSCPGQNLRAGQFVVPGGARLDQPQFAGVAVQHEEHAVGQQEAAQAEGGFAFAGPDLLAVEAQAGEQAALLLADGEQVALVHDRRVHLGVPLVDLHVEDRLGLERRRRRAAPAPSRCRRRSWRS